MKKCLNCGHAAEGHGKQCTHCNIPFSYYGFLQEVSSSNIREQKVEGIQCSNCNGIQSDAEALRCEYCNYPIKREDNGVGAKKRAFNGFAWNDVGQNSVHMVANGIASFCRPELHLKTY